MRGYGPLAGAVLALEPLGGGFLVHDVGAPDRRVLRAPGQRPGLLPAEAKAAPAHAEGGWLFDKMNRPKWLIKAVKLFLKKYSLYLILSVVLHLEREPQSLPYQESLIV